MKNEMQIDKKNIENLFMFKYIMLFFFFWKKDISRKKNNPCIFIWKCVNIFQFETIQMTTKV
jgi:hypothetical protein